MRVLLQSRMDLFSRPGGDTTHILRTKEYLGQRGVLCDISTELRPNVSSYDLVHIFNITRPYESWLQLVNAKRSRKKVIFTPIYQNFSEWDQKGRYGWQQIFSWLKNKDAKEFIKNVARFSRLRHPQLLLTTLTTRYSTLQKKLITMCDFLVVNSISEYECLQNITPETPGYTVAYLGVDPPPIVDKKIFSKKYNCNNFILCVANFASIKNHINLLKAMTGINIPVVLIGRPIATHQNYFAGVQTIAKGLSNVLIITKATREEIYSAYANASVHVLPSWTESCGLVNLEAGLMGCNIVSTDRGFAKEYLKDMAWYCQPDKIESIREAILKAYRAPKTERLSQYIAKHYRWDQHANITHEVYQKVLTKV